MKPTISGAISESRDQVLITVLSPVFSLEIFFINFGSTNGPFFELLLIVFFYFPKFYILNSYLTFGLLWTIHLDDHFFGLRVLRPPVTLPHIVFGRLVPRGCLPSPPPYGWSTGFIALPRTVGRMPLWRLRPALPKTTKRCSSLETLPIEA